MATLTAVPAARTGLDFIGDSVLAETGGDTFPNTGRELVVLANGDDSDTTVTFVTPVTVDGKAVANRAVVVPAGESRLCGPFQPGIYNNAAGGVDITYSSATDLTVYVVKVP